MFEVSKFWIGRIVFCFVRLEASVTKCLFQIARCTQEGLGLLNQGVFTQLCVQFRKDYISCPRNYLMNSHKKRLPVKVKSAVGI